MPRVLIVDDEVVITTQLGERLSSMGYEVVGTASSGEASIEMAKRFRPDVVLMDIVMPGELDGIEASEIIRAELDIPVIFLTAYADDRFVERAKSVGPFGYIVKPSHEDEIRAAIEVALCRKNVEERLRESEEKYRSVVDNVSDAIITVDVEGKVRFWNRRAESVFGYTSDEMAGESVSMLLSEPLRERFSGGMEGIISAGASGVVGGSVETTGRRKDGSEFPMEYSFSSWETGKGVFLTGIFRDITERKRMQDALREAEKKTRDQERLAAVGQLAAGVAHDFNNLLTGIIGYAELLEMREDMPRGAKSDANRIVEQGQHAAHLIRQILDFSRKSIIQRRPLDLVSFLKEMVGFLGRTIPENIHIVLNVDSKEHSVHADPTQMRQMLTNLAVNARDAMSEGGELRFRLSRRTLAADEPPPQPEMSPGEWAVVSISDTGVGISPDVLPHIYEPFFTTKDPALSHGTGLGLAQVYGIVAQHDGFIDVESQVGEGTTFFVYLPVLSVRKEEESERKASKEVSRGQGETILVVEDDSAVLDVLGRTLERSGYHVLSAANAQEALAAYAQHGDEVALVLTDMMMPGMGGMELFYALKEQTPDVKVMVMTGYSLKDQGEILRSQGIVGWLEKPVARDELTHLVREALT